MMSLNIWKIDPAKPEKKCLEVAAEILKKDGIVVAPTETKYGLLGRIDRVETVKKIYEIKKRNLNVPTAIFVRNLEEISDFGYHNDVSTILAKKFLPGPLTLILKAKIACDSPIVVNGKIGLRLSSSEIISRLLCMVDFRLTATSANISGSGDCETVRQVAQILGPAVSLYLDGGRLGDMPSTVVDCSGSGFMILRPGAVNNEEIENTLATN